MLVGERMSHPVITIAPELPINTALNIMRQENVRRTPVIEEGKLIGIVSDKDLLNASPSPVSSLSIWEMNYLISKITVADVMTKDVLTISNDTPIEEAARIMADNKIGGLPVIEDSKVVGIITETDLFKIFLEIMGARDTGIRVTALIAEKIGVIAKLTRAVSDSGGNFISFGQTAGKDSTNREVTFKVGGMELEHVEATISPHVERITDIRYCC
ncbi:MAG: CBS domain-containing protein [Anaerolineae bacterium]|nr:CBS domain-containing protein [Anaerolineae bacterium]